MSWTRWTWTDRRNAALRKGRRLFEQLTADQSRRAAIGAPAPALAPEPARARPPGGAPARPPGRARSVAASPTLGDQRELETLFAGRPAGGAGGRG
jgi:hypothetical protein